MIQDSWPYFYRLIRKTQKVEAKAVVITVVDEEVIARFVAVTMYFFPHDISANEERIHETKA